MADTYTSSLRVRLQANGANDSLWGTYLNTGALQLLEDAISGRAAVTHDDTADYSLTTANGSADEARRMILNIGGALGAARNTVCPTQSKFYVAKNATTGGFATTLKTTAGTGITIPNGKTMLLFCDGTNVVEAIDCMTSPTFVTSLIAGSTTMALLNTVATTINFGGAATAINMGAGAASTLTLSFTTGIALNTSAVTTNQTTVTALAGATTLLTIGGTGASSVFAIPGTLDASGTTGALTVAGGAYIAKALNVVGAITATSASPQLTLGVLNTTSGGIKFFGSTSGNVTLAPNVAAGASVTVTLPATSVTLNDGSALTGTAISLAGGTTQTAFANATVALAIGGGATSVTNFPGSLEATGTTGSVTLAGGLYVAKAGIFTGALTAASLSTTGDIAAGAALQGNHRFYSQSAGTTSATWAGRFYNSTPALILSIRSDGVLETGLLAGSPYNIAVGVTNKALYVDNAGLIGYLSSVRAAKTNINVVESVDWLMQLSPVTFNYRKRDEKRNYTEEFDGERHYGLIAEDVVSVAPSLVFYDSTGKELRGIAYEKLTVPLLAKVQNHESRLRTLEARLK